MPRAIRTFGFSRSIYCVCVPQRREQDALEASRQSSDVATVLQSLSLESERKQPAAAPTAPAPAPPAPLVAKSERDNATRKQELGKLNKLLKDIRKFEACDPNELTPAQQRKLERKTALQAERNEILAELNGATVSFTASSSSANPDRAPQTATTTSTNKTKKQFVAIEM